MSKCVSWKKKWIRMKAWCLELDGRQDKDEFAKPIVGRGTGPAVDPVAVFSLVRFQEKEMRKVARRKYAEKVWQGGHFDIMQNVEMKEVAPQMS
jgi:hypothetical protein